MKTIASHVKILLIVIGVLSLTCCTQDQFAKRPDETITLERAHQLYEAYQPRFDVLTEFRGGKEDASYGWHSIEFYENYINYLKKESNKAGIKVSGLRLYYVAYPESDGSNNQSGYQTYMYVPTYFDKKTQGHVAFDPLHIDENGNPIPIHEIIVNGVNNRQKSSLTSFASFKSVELQESSIANMAEMCEPNCN